MLTLAVVLVVIGWLQVGQRASKCPAHYAVDTARTRRILRLLRGVPEARGILERESKTAFVCYGDATEGVLEDGCVFLLPRSHGDASNAARLAHLMLHRREPGQLDDRSIRESRLPCAELVQHAMQSERRGHELEDRLRRSLGLEPVPDTLPNIQIAYTRRCQTLRNELAASRIQ